MSITRSITQPITRPIAGGITSAIGGGSSLLFSAVLQASLIPSKAKGDDTPTFTRASTATFTDFEGVVRTVNSGEPRFSGARRVENLLSYSEDFSNAAWDAFRLTLTSGVSDHLGGTSAFTVTATDAAALLFQDAYGVSAANDCVSSIWIRRRSGTSVVNLYTPARGFETITLSSEWARYNAASVGHTSNARCGLYITDSGDEVDIAFAQLEDATGRSDTTTPSEYVSRDILSAPYHGAGIDGVMYFDTLNGNTVTDSVVTEATGIPITDAGVEDQANFNFLLWEVPTQPDGWLSQSTDANNYVEDASPGARIVNNRAGVLRQNGLTVGTVYKITVVISEHTIGRLKVLAGGNVEVLGGINGIGTFEGTFTQIINDNFFITGVDVSNDMVVESISVKPLHYNADASGPFGFLSESAGTNLLTYSEEFDNAAWLKIRAVITTDDTTAPDGTTTADKITDNSATGSSTVYTQQNATVSSGSDHTFSGFFKEDQLGWVALTTADFDAAANGTSYFDLSSGVVGTKDANHSDSGIEALGDGWYRCWVVFNSTTDLAGRCRIYVSDGDGDITVDLDGTSSIHLWGAQVEASSFPSSYIKTEAATVTRSADSLLYSDTDNISDLAGTAKCEASTLWGTAPRPVKLLERSSSAQMLYLNKLDAAEFTRAYDGTNLTQAPVGPTMLDAPQANAVAWGDALTAYYDGSPDLTPTAYDGTMGSGDLGVGNSNTGANQWNGTIRLLEIHSSEGKV